MLLGISMLRNKNLANIFYRLKLIEAFGTGIPKIMESYEGSSAKPKIEVSDNAFKLTIYNNIVNKKPENLGQVGSFSEGEQKVLDMFVSSSTLKRIDVEKVLSISQAMAVKYLKGLIEKSAIEKLGEGRNIRYRLKKNN